VVRETGTGKFQQQVKVGRHRFLPTSRPVSAVSTAVQPVRLLLAALGAARR
jgi:uncharacterized OsmC-like protein